MSNRQVTPDIMADILTGAQPLPSQVAKPTAPIAKNTYIESGEELKEKATFNLPVNLLQELEDKWMTMRKLSGSKQISKTLIVEQALEMAFADFDEKRQVGELYCKVINNKDKTAT